MNFGWCHKKNYETYAALVKELREENARYREEHSTETPQTSPIASTATQNTRKW